MKNKILKLFCVLSGVSLLSACATSGYQEFYTSYFDVSQLENVVLLNPGEEVQVYNTNNFDRDIVALESKQYITVGYSSFNGELEDVKYAKAQAKRIGATVVLVSSNYTNSLTSTSTLIIPTSKTTTSTGNVFGDGGGVAFNATSNTYSTTAVPITSTQHRYNQTAVYLVKSNYKYKIGLVYKDLPQKIRSELQRNTGVYVKAVIESSPAFYADILPHDVITDIDGHSVSGEKVFREVMLAIPGEQKESKLTIIRNGEKKTVIVRY